MPMSTQNKNTKNKKSDKYTLAKSYHSNKILNSKHNNIQHSLTLEEGSSSLLSNSYNTNMKENNGVEAAIKIQAQWRRYSVENTMFDKLTIIKLKIEDKLSDTTVFCHKMNNPDAFKNMCKSFPDLNSKNKNKYIIPSNEKDKPSLLSKFRAKAKMIGKATVCVKHIARSANVEWKSIPGGAGMGGSTSSKIYRWQQQEAMDKAIKNVKSPVKINIKRHQIKYFRGKKLHCKRFFIQNKLRKRAIDRKNKILKKKIQGAKISKIIKKSNLRRSEWGYEEEQHNRVKIFRKNMFERRKTIFNKRVDQENKMILKRLENPQVSKKWSEKDFKRHKEMLKNFSKYDSSFK